MSIERKLEQLCDIQPQEKEYTMHAAIKNIVHDGKIRPNRKENNLLCQYTYVDGLFNEPIILRIYGTSARHYACLWINTKDGWHISGGGWAGGYGYHRASAAVQNAMTDAGITLSQDIAGRGDDIIKEAIEAIAKTLKIKGGKVLKANP